MKKGPIIIASYAPRKVRYGDVLKIYIEAETPDADMLKITAVIDQEGYGHYPTDWTYLKPEHQTQFKGYLQWNTFSSRTSSLSEWTQITLKVSVVDKAGKESDAVIFPIEFVSEAIPESQPPLPFHEGDPSLGYLDINLFEPSLMGG